MSAVRTLSSDFKGRPNSLGALRLGLAGVVVVFHCWQLGGYGDEPKIGGTYVSAWGLYGFFVVSGFLILRSRLSRPSLTDFFWARALRIYPGFLVCLLLVAFVFAPLSQLLDAGADYHLSSAVRYVLRNLPLYPPFEHQQGIADTLGAAPFANNWDEPMWSLFYEASCYVLIGLIVELVPRRFVAAVVPGLFIVATVFDFLAVRGVIALPYEYVIGLVLVTLFLGGSVLTVLADRLPAARWDVLISAVLLVLITATHWEPIFAALPLAHLLIRLSTLLPLTRVGRRFDISYGVYIYGVPVQQMVNLAFPHQALPIWGFMGVVLVALIPIAFASSALIEMPALRLKSSRPRLPRVRVPRDVVVPAAETGT